MDTTISIQLEAIRAAFADGASLEDKRAGAIACRTLLAVLETQPGLPLGAPPAPSATTALASALPQLGQVNVDQVLDLVILKLRSLLPADAAVAAPRVYQVPALTLPGTGGP